MARRPADSDADHAGGWRHDLADPAAIVPGIASLAVVPYLLYKLYAPEIKATPAAAQMARDELARMGPMRADEWMMLGTFVLLLVLWIFGPQLGGLNATTAALIGLGVLLLLGVLTWKNVQEETGAWDTLVWFAALVMMASFLNKLGLVPWFSKAVGDSLVGVNWIYAFLALSLVYLYSHYLFASNTAHVGAMYAAFLGVSVAVGTPPLLAALVLAFFSNLMSSMTTMGPGQRRCSSDRAMSTSAPGGSWACWSASPTWRSGWWSVGSGGRCSAYGER